MSLIGTVISSFWTRLAITIAVLAVLLRSMDLRHVGELLLSADPAWLLITLALVAMDRLVMAWRWVLLLRAAGNPISFSKAAEIFLVSSFIGSFLPAGIGADLSRAYGVAQQTRERGDAVASIAVDRVLGMAAIVLLGVAGIAIWGRREEAGVGQTVTVSVAVTLAFSAAVLWSDVLVRRLLPQDWHAHGQVGRVLRLADAIGRYRGRRSMLVVVLLLSIGVQLLRILQAYCLGVALGMQVGLGYYLVFMPVALLLLLLPISISGFGMPQGAIVWLLAPVGVPAAQAFALSTLIILNAFAGNLPGAWLYLRRRPDAP